MCAEKEEEELHHIILLLVKEQAHLLGWESEARGHHLWSCSPGATNFHVGESRVKSTHAARVCYSIPLQFPVYCWQPASWASSATQYDKWRSFTRATYRSSDSLTWSFLSSVAVLWTTFFFLLAVPWGRYEKSSTVIKKCTHRSLKLFLNYPTTHLRCLPFPRSLIYLPAAVVFWAYPDSLAWWLY